MVAILFSWKEAFRALEIQNQKPFSLSRVSSVFLSGITPKTFSFYSLAFFRALLWYFCIFRLSLSLSNTNILTHKYVQIHIYLYISFLWQCQMYSAGTKPCSCPDYFLPQPPHNLVWETVASAAAAVYFSKKLGFPFTWAQKQDKYSKVPQWCVRNMRRMRQRHIWAMLVTMQQVHTSRQHIHISSTHTFIKVFFYWLSMDCTALWKNSGEFFAVLYVFIVFQSHLQLKSYCVTSAFSCSVHYWGVWYACFIWHINLMQSDGWTFIHRIRTICMKLP